MARAATEAEPRLQRLRAQLRAATLRAESDAAGEALADLTAGKVEARPQDGSLATYAPILKKEDGLIDWSQPAAAIACRVRGFQPWPGAYTRFRGQALNVWRARAVEATGAAGTFVRVKPPVVATGQGGLELIEVQLEGRKRMAASDFANGQRLKENEVLGERPR